MGRSLTEPKGIRFQRNRRDSAKPLAERVTRNNVRWSSMAGMRLVNVGERSPVKVSPSLEKFAMDFKAARRAAIGGGRPVAS